MLSVAIASLLAVATLVLVTGLGWRIARYTATPVPLAIPTMPAPLTRAGAAARVGREVVLFESLFGADKLLWLAAMLFHVGLLLVLLRHLRYVFPTPPLLIVFVQPFGKLGALAMMAGALLLLARRLVLPPVRFISRPSDVAMLLLLLAIGATGLAMTYFVHTDIIGLKQFCLGLPLLELRPLPTTRCWRRISAWQRHCSSCSPFSKLLHIPGVFFSPTRNQADNSRERRRVAPGRASWMRHVMADFAVPVLADDFEPASPPALAPDAMAHCQPFYAPAGGTTGRWAFLANSCRIGKHVRSPRLGELLERYRRCVVYHGPASSAAPAPTSATSSSAPAIRRTCRWHGKTCCAASTAATSPRPASSAAGSVPATSTRPCCRTATPTSTSARNAAAARCSARSVSTPPRSPWPRAKSWTASAWARNTVTRSSARFTRSATISACRGRRWPTPWKAWKKTSWTTPASR